MLRERIEHGQAADILASADMVQPRKLLARKQLMLTQDQLPQRLLDPALCLAPSTPGADPSGDYAWQVFTASKLSVSVPGPLEVETSYGMIVLTNHSSAMTFVLSEQAQAIFQRNGFVPVALASP